MDNRLIQSAKQLNKRRRRRRAWTRGLLMLSCAVALGTIYVMSLPAITQEKDTFCDIKTHEHTVECYTKLKVETTSEMSCILQEMEPHVHTDACYAFGTAHEHADECYEMSGGHVHEDSCYEVIDGHIHGDGCYAVTDSHAHAETCYEMTEGHTHGDSCYTTVIGHTHGTDCYDAEDQLICTMAEVADSRMLSCTLEEGDGKLTLSCEKVEDEAEKVLVCTQEETEAQRVLICTEPETEAGKLLVCTEEKTLVCTLAEQEGHSHGDQCFYAADEDPLTCTQEESEEHKHTELCYGQWERVCQKQVHTHSLICYSNPKADVENANQWEKTFRDVKITGLHREDLLAIARTQLGYRESSRNYMVREDGKTTDGYTRYGDWYGYTYGEWCAMFVSFCLEYAEVPDVPHHAACQAWIDVLDDLEMYIDAKDQKPLPGYLIFFDWNGDGYSNHVGLVEDIKEDGTIVTIEGNSGNQVTRVEYESADPRVMGYGVVPEGELLPGETVPKESEATTEFEETTESEAPTEEATEPLDWAMLQKVPVYLNNKRDELVMDADEIYVTGDLPDGANIYAVPVAVETEGEILCAYQISILLPDFTAYIPTLKDNLQIIVKNPEFENEDLQIRSSPAEGEYRVISGTTNGQSVAFFLDTSDPFAIVKMPAAMSEQTIRAAIYTDATFQQLAEDETAILIAGLLPEGAAARAYAVALQEDLIEGQTVLLAYDITIVDSEGNLIESSEEHPFIVSIQPPGWTPSEDEKYSIYYVPEDGEPEMIMTQSQDDLVSFETDHFSTYALTATGTSATIYLNGASGNDSNNGTSSGRAVKTLEKALSLVKNGGTIYITGTVTVSETQEWDLTNEVKIIRQSSFSGPLVTVKNGTTLTLKNISFNGGSGNPGSTSITKTDYASGSAKAPLIVVESGATLNIQAGAVLENNSNKPDTSGGNFKENGYVGQGGAVYCQGNLNMSGGTIRNCEAQSGGGIYIESAGTGQITFNLSGGTITNNYARDIVAIPSSGHKPYHKNAGGGVYVGDYVTMNMSGGTISNNQSSREGGGVSLGWLNRNNGSAIYDYITFFNMTGGTFTGNLATSTGGGLNITAGRSAEISAGYFTNNTANGKEYQPGDSSSSWSVYSGGAIYLDAKQLDRNGNYAGKPGYAKIHRALITNNTADLYGGGIATCDTSSGTVNASVEMDGTLIYGNTASSGNEMYLNGDTNLVGNKMLGGGTYSWTRSGASYDNSLTENSSDVKKGKPLATVIITGNHAGVDGGGIGCNGEIEIGGQPDTESISITKVWNDDGTVPHPDSITVQVYNGNQPYGDPITIYPTVDANGKVTWPTVYVDNLPEGGNYTVKEVKVPGFDSTVTANGSSFTITNTPTGFSVVKKWVGDTANDRPSSIQVQLFQDGTAYGEPVELNAGNNWKYMWMNLPDGFTYTAREVEVPDGYYVTGDGELLDADTWQITNTLSPLTSISVEKRWEGGDPLDSVTVYLLSNGVQISEATLSAANNWFYKWDNLPVYGKLGAELEYTVEEANVRGYESSIREATSADATKSWTQVTGLASGKTYLLISGNGALTVNGSTLAWTDASAALNSGTADDSQMWTYNSNKLQNENGKYLNLDSTSLLFGTYFFEAADSGSNISYSDGYLGVSGILSTRYFDEIGDEGKASVSTNKSEATKFTFYEYSTNEGSWGEDHYIVTNTKLPDSIEFHFAKYAVGSAPEPTLLAGAQLELYKVSDEGVTIPGTEQTGTLLRSWTSESGNSENGGYRIEDLYSGIYYLIETYTPEGHLGLSGPIIFEVQAESGQVNVISSPYELTFGTGQSVYFPIYNQVTYELPQTGGIGTTLYTFGGLLLILIALALLLYNNKRRRGAAIYY